MEGHQMELSEMLAILDKGEKETAEIGRWNYAPRSLRTVILGMIEFFTYFVTPDEIELTPNAENIINKSWNDLDNRTQEILTAHGITAD